MFKSRPISERFHDKWTPEPNTGCWLWTGTTNHAGYGIIHIDAIKKIRAHRASYEIFIGPIPKGMFICHKCDTPPCVNPDHLFADHPKGNSVDMVKKGRCTAGWQNKIKTHCVRGHKFTDENTGLSKQGLRHCKTCGRHGAARRKREKRLFNKKTKEKK